MPSGVDTHTHTDIRTKSISRNQARAALALIVLDTKSFLNCIGSRKSRVMGLQPNNSDQLFNQYSLIKHPLILHFSLIQGTNISQISSMAKIHNSIFTKLTRIASGITTTLYNVIFMNVSKIPEIFCLMNYS